MPTSKAHIALLVIASAIVGCGGGGGGGSGPGVPPPPPPAGDTTPPDTAYSGGPPALTSQRTADFILVSELNATFEVSLDGAAFAPVSSPYSLTNLADGQHTVSFRARDTAGNLDGSPATHTWIIESVPPTAKIWFPGNVAYTDAPSIQVRAYVLESHDIASVTMNGVAATYSFQSAMWVARVPLTTGSNTITVATRDNLGNADPQAATAVVVNRGVALSKLKSLTFDAPRARVLAVDWNHNAIVALRTSDGLATILSDSAHGTGPELSFPRGLVVDAARNRALTYDTFSQRVMAIDLVSGNRSYVSNPPPSQQFTIYGDLDYDAASNTAYVASAYPPAVVAIDLNTSTRTFITSNALGAGPAMTQMGHARLDTSQSSGPRLLVAEIGALPGSEVSRLLAVDTAGNRTVLSSGSAPLVGAGPPIYGMGNFIVDAANNRALAIEYRESGTQRLFAIDLANGDRTVLVDTAVTSAHGSLAYDAAAARAYLGLGDRSRVLRFDLATQQLAPFVESNVGSGPVPAGYNSLSFDPYGLPGLVAGVQTNPYGGSAGVIRIDILSGERTTLADNSTGSGPLLRVAHFAQRDTRPGQNVSQFIVYDSGVLPGRLYSVGPPFGDRRLLSSTNLDFGASMNMALDPDAGRMLTGLTPGLGPPAALVGIDVETGTQTTISGSGAGTGPDLGTIVAVAVDNRMGVPKRYVVATQNPAALIVVDPTTGNRSTLTGSGVGAGPPLTDPIDIDLDMLGQLLVLGVTGTLQSVDLTSGNRTHLSGLDTADQTMRGMGPRVLGAGSRLAQLTSATAYVTTNEDSILAIDLESGDRAIVSR